MAYSEDAVRGIYRKRAPLYDWTANAYYAAGFREMRYRRMAVERLDPQPGQTVVELGCGTGINFPLLQRRIGPGGRLIGVDLTGAMLARARRKVAANGWTNVELVEADMADYTFPSGVDRIISTFALTLSPHYEEVIRRGRRALAPGGTLVVLDLKAPRNAHPWLIRLAALTARPFAVTADLAGRHPWEIVEREFDAYRFDELYFGFSFIATGVVGRGGGTTALPRARGR